MFIRYIFNEFVQASIVRYGRGETGAGRYHRNIYSDSQGLKSRLSPGPTVGYSESACLILLPEWATCWHFEEEGRTAGGRTPPAGFTAMSSEVFLTYLYILSIVHTRPHGQAHSGELCSLYSSWPISPAAKTTQLSARRNTLVALITAFFGLYTGLSDTSFWWSSRRIPSEKPTITTLGSVLGDNHTLRIHKSNFPGPCSYFYMNTTPEDHQITGSRHHTTRHTTHYHGCPRTHPRTDRLF